MGWFFLFFFFKFEQGRTVRLELVKDCCFEDIRKIKEAEEKSKITYQANTQRRIRIRAVEDSQHGLAHNHHSADGERHPPQHLLGDEPVARGLGALATAVGRPPHALLPLPAKGTTTAAATIASMCVVLPLVLAVRLLPLLR